MLQEVRTLETTTTGLMSFTLQSIDGPDGEDEEKNGEDDNGDEEDEDPKEENEERRPLRGWWY